jgi:glyoxylase-like metal-dependent hydrolase (beta-lactamase superfamily II)
MTTTLTRRAALFAAASLPLAPALMPRPAFAAAGLQGPQTPVFNRFKLGAFEVTTLLAGTRQTDKLQETFGMNVTPEVFNAAAEENFLPADVAQTFFTPTLVNTGSELVLFDTGLSAAGTGAALSAAGISPDQVDVVVLTHMHGDHIGGMTAQDGSATYANARYVTGTAEYDHWAAAGNEGFDKLVKPFADQMTFVNDGATASPGITAMLAAGHTPGHMIYMLESNGQRLAIAADTANHHVFSLAHPDWDVRFDMDKVAAAATRRSVFGMLAADRVPFIGYHMPFPGMGYVEARGNGFYYVPVSYQMMLNG